MTAGFFKAASNSSSPADGAKCLIWNRKIEFFKFFNSSILQGGCREECEVAVSRHPY